jgi:isocitrate lyase
MRADQIDHMDGKKGPYWFAPIVADAEAGFGGILNSFELMKAMIEAGAAAVHLEDQLSSAKKCGHLGGKVIIPTSEAVKKLIAARLAADICGVPTILIGRTDANSATLLANDVDERDRLFITGTRTAEGFYTVRNGIEPAIDRALAYAPYADILWCETSEPDLAEARRFAEAVHASYPGKLLAYNLSPSFNWSAKLDKSAIGEFQKELASCGYRFQFVTLAGFHSINFGMYEMARDFEEKGMSAYARFQDNEFAWEKLGYKAVKHQSFVGAGYFDAVAQAISGDELSTSALKGSTEEKQFQTATA